MKSSVRYFQTSQVDYLTNQVLPAKMVKAIEAREIKRRAHASKIIRRFKERFCESDGLGGWKCLDIMLELTVREMEMMLKVRRR